MNYTYVFAVCRWCGRVTRLSEKGDCHLCGAPANSPKKPILTGVDIEERKPEPHD